MKRIYQEIKEIHKLLFKESPFIVITVFLSAVLTGLIAPVSVWVNSRIFNMGADMLKREIGFKNYIPYLILFVMLSLLPIIIGDIFINSYIFPKCRLIYRTAYKGKMLKKLKNLRYEHFENEQSKEIIEKAYGRIEDCILSLFPSALFIGNMAVKEVKL